MAQTYRVQQFAALAGVTVRALHHYDRLGLLKPRRTDAGYRVYVESDLTVLEQIVALKFLGFSLTDIKGVLRKNPDEMSSILRAQHALLADRRRRIDDAMRVIAEADTRLRDREPRDVAVMTTIIEVLTMQNANTDAERYEALLERKIETLKTLTPERLAGIREEWNALGREIEAALDQDPASDVAQTLASRWVSMLAVFNQGQPVPPDMIRRSAGRNETSSWPASGPFANPALWTFIEKALAARR